MSSPTSGCVVRRSDSVQPVHSWKWSQITDGFFPAATFSAIFSAAEAGRPTAAAAAVQTLRKSRRETPVAPTGTSFVQSMEFPPGAEGRTTAPIVVDPDQRGP